MTALHSFYLVNTMSNRWRSFEGYSLFVPNLLCTIAGDAHYVP